MKALLFLLGPGDEEIGTVIEIQAIPRQIVYLQKGYINVNLQVLDSEIEYYPQKDLWCLGLNFHEDLLHDEEVQKDFTSFLMEQGWVDWKEIKVKYLTP